jgi:hypothetical protein
MKVIFCLLFCFFSLLPIFSQNVADDIIMSYQDEIELWLNQNNVYIESKLQRYNEIDLFTGPYVYPKYPAPKYFGRGGDVIECFAVGKFLTRLEKERVYTRAYSCIPQDAKQRFSPFATFENFRNSLIFNPNMLFGNPANRELNSDFAGEFAYLIFYFGSYSERFPDNVFNLQSRQLENGNNRGMLIFPYSFYYALFRINSIGDIELISYYGIG